jgi:hypothetical protein
MNTGEILIYQNTDGNIMIDVRLEEETVWLPGKISPGYTVSYLGHPAQRLKEYIIKGFTLNDDRFKTGSSINYFSELQERIRQIRLSEKFFYQKIKDIYATCCN